MARQFARTTYCRKSMPMLRHSRSRIAQSIHRVYKRVFRATPLCTLHTFLLAAVCSFSVALGFQAPCTYPKTGLYHVDACKEDAEVRNAKRRLSRKADWASYTLTRERSIPHPRGIPEEPGPQSSHLDVQILLQNHGYPFHPEDLVKAGAAPRF